MASSFIHNPDQDEIISAPVHKRQLVLACPGSGKTEVVARRLAYLVSQGCGLRPRQILVLSFSRSAVKVLMDRVGQVLHEEPVTYQDLRHIAVRTFDSWAFRILRLIGYLPIDLLNNDYEKNIEILIDEMRDPEARTKLIQDEDKLKKIQHIIVDECQDLSGVRAGLVRELLLLRAPPNNFDNPDACGFTLLGDMNQAIYDWVGRDDTRRSPSRALSAKDLVDFVRSEYKSHIHVVNLFENYRSHDEIIELVNESAKILEGGSRKSQDALREIAELARIVGDNVELQDLSTYFKDIAPGDSIAVLARNNGEALYIASILQKDSFFGGQIMFILQAGDPPPIIPPWVAILLGEFRASELTKTNFVKLHERYKDGVNLTLPDVSIAWQMLLKASRKPERSTSIDMSQLRERIIWQDSLPDDEGIERPDYIMTTVHQSKGQEFDTVCLLDSSSGEYDEDDGEEAKIFYVGISRAKKRISVLDREGVETFYPKDFADGTHRRWERAWPKGWRNLEMGIRGDIDDASFVSTEVHGSEDAVNNVQQILRGQGEKLIGRKLMLCKRVISYNPVRVVYDIALQEDNRPGLVLGRTSQRLTVDLLDIMFGLRNSRQYALPTRIFELRISQITTVVGDALTEKHIASPWNYSKLWLGIIFHGLGFFQYKFKR